MPLNLPAGRSANSAPMSASFLRYAATTGIWSTRDGEIDISGAIWDLANVRTGWLKFASGEPPDFAWDVGGKALPRPSKEHRRRFSLRLALGPEVYELTSTSTGVISAIVRLHGEYERAAQRASGLLPVVWTGAPVAVETSFGKVLDPVLLITDWTRRPAVLPHTPQPISGLPATRDELDDELPPF
jgi:hypothetical protein